MRILVTGGCGFIGSAFVRRMLDGSRRAGTGASKVSIVNLDKLTYAGNPRNVEAVADSPSYRFVLGDICDRHIVADAMAGCDVVVNFAAETHVDRSLLGDTSFVDTDVKGVLVLLEEAKRIGVSKFVQISTDEVYGSIESGAFTEESTLRPRNPYSAAKAGGDRIAYSYWASYGVPVVITRASNNYGPYQYPEKLIPLFVTNALDDLPLPLYGDGRNVRDWLYVDDHAAAVDFLIENGVPGEVYNVAGGNECENVEITKKILSLLGKPETLIRRVADRVGHDRRYSLDASKLAALGFRANARFDEALAATIDWYVAHPDWWRPIKEHDPHYRDFYKTQYHERLRS